MITPQFTVEQNDKFIIVLIRAPYIKASAIQFEVEGDLFVFSLPPYYLRLHLPGKVVEDELMNSSYDLETSTVKCTISKAQPGEHFPDLAMLSKMLARKQTPRIEELDTRPEMDEDVDFEEIEQDVPHPLSGGIKYGFNNGYDEIVGVSAQAGNEINELKDPEHSTLAQRAEADAAVAEEFDVDHYFSDLYDNPMIGELVAWQAPGYEMSSKDNDRIAQLPSRSIVATEPKQTYIGIIGLLFGQAYDMRINMGDSTVESAWCVGKLCPLMSCLLPQQTVGGIVQSCTRRSLVFPLYRSWALTLAVWKDVERTLSAGRPAILQRLVQLLDIFENDQHACYRKVWVEDYVLFIQYASDKVVLGLAHELQKALAALSKADVGIELDEYEEAAREALEEQAAADSDDEEN